MKHILMTLLVVLTVMPLKKKVTQPVLVKPPYHYPVKPKCFIIIFQGKPIRVCRG